MTYKEAIKQIEDLYVTVPEMNISNYTHEEVIDTLELTNQIWQILQSATE